MTTTSLRILERPVYGTTEAASILGLRAARVRAWLDGYVRGGILYEPVIRPEHTGSDVVTWGEFVELGYLREYRRKGVPLQRLRPVVAALRAEFETPYPLATARPFIAGKELVLEVQEEFDIPAAIAIVIRSGQGLIVADDANRYLKKVEFVPAAEGAAQRLRPAGATSPVVIDPMVRFGRPTVAGVTTERLWELFDAGETTNEVAAGYDMDENLVGAAIAYEEQQRALAA